MAALTRVAPGGVLGKLLVVGGAGGCGAALYGALALLLRFDEVGLLYSAIKDGLRRLRA